jgi:hypothetical protein
MIQLTMRFVSVLMKSPQSSSAVLPFPSKNRRYWGYETARLDFSYWFGRVRCAMTAPRDPDHLAALIEWRVAELRVLAAQTAVDFGREQSARLWDKMLSKLKDGRPRPTGEVG